MVAAYVFLAGDLKVAPTPGRAGETVGEPRIAPTSSLEGGRDGRRAKGRRRRVGRGRAEVRGGGRSSYESLSERSIGVRKADRTSGGGRAKDRAYS